jgi:hypothetical protein
LVGLFNKKKEKMSWQIPTQIEQDIIAGKATYRTFQTGNGGQSILPVPANSYAVIFGYDFSPAGGGFKRITDSVALGDSNVLTDFFIRFFETQQISFYTGKDFYPFIHHVDTKTTSIIDTVDATIPAAETTRTIRFCEEMNNTPLARQVYITSANDVTITHGLILNATPATAGPIPVSSRTPGFLTYGGSGQLIQAQTNYGPNATPLQFIQPSTKDFEDFALGLLPSNATDQAFATPDTTNGLIEANFLMAAIGVNATSAATNYYLCLHYALYSTQIPNTQG